MACNISERIGISLPLLLESRTQKEFGGVHLRTGSQGQWRSAHTCDGSGKRGTEKEAPKKFSATAQTGAGQRCCSLCQQRASLLWGPSITEGLQATPGPWPLTDMACPTADWGRQALGNDVASLPSFSSCLLLGCFSWVPVMRTNRAADKAQELGPVLSSTAFSTRAFADWWIFILCLANLLLDVWTSILKDGNHNILSERYWNRTVHCFKKKKNNPKISYIIFCQKLLEAAINSLITKIIP